MSSKPDPKAATSKRSSRGSSRSSSTGAVKGGGSRAPAVVVVHSPESQGAVQRMLLTDRGDPSVPPPSWEALPSHFLFDADGLPRPDVVKEHFKREGLLSEADALQIITRCAMIWKDEPNVLRLEDPVVICGDIHGQFYDLLTILDLGGDPSTQKYIFLGDYADRGCFGTEVILLLMCYKIRYPRTVVMLRGNHESRHLTAYFNFKREVQYKYSLAVYNAIMSAYDCLPLSCILNGRFMCVHGGLSPEIKRISDINAIHRFREPPSSGPMCDLLWSDPMDEKEGDPNYPQPFVPNTTRGCSYVYSHLAAASFLEANELVTVIRGHEAQDEGYHIYKKGPSGFPSVICVFSAPNYCDTYDNRGAIIMFDKNILNIRQYNSTPHPYYLPNFMNAFAWSLPFVAEKLLDIWTNVFHLVGSEDDLSQAGSTASSLMTAPNAPGSPIATAATQQSFLNEHGDIIRAKILAMGKMSRMFRTLREENESILELKGLAGGTLPSGVLQGGPEAIEKAIRGFKQSKEVDKGNERWPDTPVESELDDPPNAVTEALLKRESSDI